MGPLCRSDPTTYRIMSEHSITELQCKFECIIIIIIIIIIIMLCVP